MTALVAIALAIGLLSSEVLARCMRQDAWPARRFATMRHELQCFHKADNDDARQAHIISSGVATLTLSLASLAVIGVIAIVFVAPIVLLDWNTTDSTIYSIDSAVSAIAWWMFRGRRHRT